MPGGGVALGSTATEVAEGAVVGAGGWSVAVPGTAVPGTAVAEGGTEVAVGTKVTLYVA